MNNLCQSQRWSLVSIIAVADRAHAVVKARLSHDNWVTHRDVVCKDITDACGGVHVNACSRLFMVRCEVHVGCWCVAVGRAGMTITKSHVH
jgi:hypothetical protein